MAKKKLSKKKRRIRLIRRIILLTILLAIAIGLLVFSPKIIKIIGLAQEAKSLVSKSTADTFRESGTTVIYDTDGNELCTMRESKDMYYVEMDNIPDTLAQAFIVMEDKDFYSHKGIDFKAIIRAIIANTENDEIVQGASTITQQLAKNIFLSQDVTWERKVKEMFVARDLEKKYSNSHFAPFLSHEAFHYYMQNDWKIISPPITGLSDDDKKLLKEEYNILNNIQEELLSKTNNKDTLLKYAKHYVDIVSKRIDKNNDYLMSELSKETAEGTAQYVGIKAAQIVNYDYGVMYFDNIKNVPFSDIFVQLEKGTIHTDYLYKRIPYESGALLCFLFDELGIPNWQQKLNAQTEENPVTLYDILNEYLN